MGHIALLSSIDYAKTFLVVSPVIREDGKGENLFVCPKNLRSRKVLPSRTSGKVHLKTTMYYQLLVRSVSGSQQHLL